MLRTFLTLPKAGTSAALVMLLTGCSTVAGLLPKHAHQPKTTPVNIVSAGLVAQRSGPPELAVTLRNASKQTLWINVHFQTPGGTNDCFMGKELAAGHQQLLLCPQPDLQADTDYPIKITGYDSPAEDKSVAQLDTTLHFSRADIQAANG